MELELRDIDTHRRHVLKHNLQPKHNNKIFNCITEAVRPTPHSQPRRSTNTKMTLSSNRNILFYLKAHKKGSHETVRNLVAHSRHKSAPAIAITVTAMTSRQIDTTLTLTASLGTATHSFMNIPHSCPFKTLAVGTGEEKRRMELGMVISSGAVLAPETHLTSAKMKMCVHPLQDMKILQTRKKRYPRRLVPC